MTNDRFDIQPYIGALLITFGMSRSQVHRRLGLPESSHPIWDGSGLSDSFGNSRCTVGYDTSDVVNHVGFSPGRFHLLIQGKLIWTPKDSCDPNPIFLALDPEPMECVGFWYFLQIGLTTTGYHDDDPAQWAVTVFPPAKVLDLPSEVGMADTRKYQAKPSTPNPPSVEQASRLL